MPRIVLTGEPRAAALTIADIAARRGGDEHGDTRRVLIGLGLIPDDHVSSIEAAIAAGWTREHIRTYFGVGSSVMHRLTEKHEARLARERSGPV